MPNRDEWKIKLSEDEREFWLRKRQALIIELGAIEDMLGLKRSIEPKHKKADRDWTGTLGHI